MHNTFLKYLHHLFRSHLSDFPIDIFICWKNKIYVNFAPMYPYFLLFKSIFNNIQEPLNTTVVQLLNNLLLVAPVNKYKCTVMYCVQGFFLLQWSNHFLGLQYFLWFTAREGFIYRCLFFLLSYPLLVVTNGNFSIYIKNLSSLSFINVSMSKTSEWSTYTHKSLEFTCFKLTRQKGHDKDLVRLWIMN